MCYNPEPEHTVIPFGKVALSQVQIQRRIREEKVQSAGSTRQETVKIKEETGWQS
jgi:hypothetical protein